MKNLRLAGIGLSLLLMCATASAQEKPIPINEPDYNKPLLFADLPDKIPVEASYLKSLLNNDMGKDVQVRLAGNQKTEFFNGRIVSTATRNNKNSSVVIRSGNFSGASLTVTEVVNPDGNTSFIGRIISLQHGDLFELQSENGQYYFIKRKFYDLINE